MVGQLELRLLGLVGGHVEQCGGVCPGHCSECSSCTKCQRHCTGLEAELLEGVVLREHRGCRSLKCSGVFELCFVEDDVLVDNRVKLAQCQLLLCDLGGLLEDVEEASTSTRDQLDD